MRKETLRLHFGSYVKAARALGVSKAAVSNWDDEKIPEGIAYKAQVITRGKLRVDPDDYRKREAH